MIQVHVTMTGRGYSPKESYRIFAEDLHSFRDLKAARQWVREAYGTAKRQPMFCDEKDGSAKQIGYVIGFRAGDCSHSPVSHWLQQDWVEFREVKAISPH